MDRRAFARRSNPNSSCAESFGPRRRVKSGDDESLRCRDAPSHPSFAKKTPRKAKPKTPPLKQGRRSAERRTTGPHRKAMRRASFLLPLMLRGPRPPGPHGAGALAFRRPTAASEVFSASARLRPRFLEPPDANGRTLSGTSAASTSQSGTRRTGRCPSRPRAQCIATLDENRSRSALRSTLAKAIICHLTKSVSHGNILLRYCPKGKCNAKAPETSPANDDGPIRGPFPNRGR
jgi:hypothetical protein